LTGDVVPFSTEDYWDAAVEDMDKLDLPVYIAAGNHDRSDVFLNRFEQYYFSFRLKNDLFIVLSPTDWNIEGAQKEFLINTIDDASAEVNNIFIFCHELIWWSPDNEYKNVEINYEPHYPGSNNFWSEIEPYLNSIPHEVVIFAGDMGATAAVSPYMYHRFDNISLVGSGMGGGQKDNMVIVEVNSNGEISYQLIHLNGTDPYGLENLVDFLLP